MFCVDQFSITINGRDTGIFPRIGKNIPIVQCQGEYLKMSNFGSF